MLEIIIKAGAKKLTSIAGGKLLESYRNRLNRRVSTFFDYLDISYEVITEESLSKLYKYIESEEGEELLANYAEIITKTSSKRALMVMVMLYCNDRDLKLSKTDILIFVRALDSIDDITIDFFLKCVDISVSPLNVIPYPVASINYKNLNEFCVDGWGQAEISIYVNDLIQRRLLLPNPQVGAFSSAEDGRWAVLFGVSTKSKKFANAFKKAEDLINTVT